MVASLKRYEFEIEAIITVIHFKLDGSRVIIVPE